MARRGVTESSGSENLVTPMRIVDSDVANWSTISTAKFLTSSAACHACTNAASSHRQLSRAFSIDQAAVRL